MKKAVVLLSGGMDSATALAIARQSGFACYALSIDYGQRHVAELAAAARIGQSLQVSDHQFLKLDLAVLASSALTDLSATVPLHGTSTGIPVTYVPARNTIMLSLALAWAEVLGSHDIFMGVTAVDYSGYPDCRATISTGSEVPRRRNTAHRHRTGRTGTALRAAPRAGPGTDGFDARRSGRFRTGAQHGVPDCRRRKAPGA